MIDVRLAARALAKSRGFTAAAVLTLALGTTLSTTATVVIKAYLLTGLPYPAADRLFWLRYQSPGQDGPRGMELLDWSSLGDVIEHPIAWDLDMFYLLGGAHAESFPGAWVTQGFVEGLGIQPAIGRGFDATAFAPGGENVALISHRLWTGRFGGDPNAIGKAFTAYVSDRPDEAESFRVIGVMPPGFWHINPYTDVLAPLRVPTHPYMARLRPGVAPATAAARVTSLVTSGARNLPPGWTATIVSAHDAHVAQVRPALRMVSVAAALVLLVACANVAGLLLVRASRRQRDIAVRSALGAGRGAIARMLLAEALVLGGAATVLALMATSLTLQSLASLIQQQLGRPAPGGTLAFSIDARVMAIAIAIGIVTVVVCTLVPLATSLRPRLLDALQSGSRSATEGRRSQRIRAALIAMEVAVSLALLAGSALMLRSVVALLAADLGFNTERILNASLTLRQNRYPDSSSRIAMFDRVTSRVGAIPGVEAVGLTNAWPAQQPQPVPVEKADAQVRAATRSAVHGISDGYFETLGIPLVAGRAFARADRAGSEPVAIVSESLARRLWPVGNAVGSHIVAPHSQEPGQPLSAQRLVVGIVRDVRQNPGDEDLADVYVPMLQAPTRFAFVLVRTTGAPAAALGAVRNALHEIDPELALDRARPMQMMLDEATARPRFTMSLLGAFALAAAILALIGVYGVVAYAVRQREREIAVRLAVGADPARITRLFVRQGGVILGAGLGIGMVATLAAGRLIESQLVGVTPQDPMALTLAVAAFGGAGLVAVWWPARRAAATDPAIALRAE